MLAITLVYLVLLSHCRNHPLPLAEFMYLGAIAAPSEFFMGLGWHYLKLVWENARISSLYLYLSQELLQLRNGVAFNEDSFRRKKSPGYSHLL